ncbi:MAG: hypothetical protein R3E85_07605 [Planctomycetota bacterium]
MATSWMRVVLSPHELVTSMDPSDENLMWSTSPQCGVNVRSTRPDASSIRRAPIRPTHGQQLPVPGHVEGLDGRTHAIRL